MLWGYTPVALKTNAQFCDIEMTRDSAEGKDRIHVRLVYDKSWKFENVFFNERQGKPCNLWASTMRDHPLATFAHLHGEEILDTMEDDSDQELNWRESIVDLMKLLKLDSSLTARKTLATELHYSGDMGDSAKMNVWLHKQVMTKLAENGGKVPTDLTH